MYFEFVLGIRISRRGKKGLQVGRVRGRNVGLAKQRRRNSVVGGTGQSLFAQDRRGGKNKKKNKNKGSTTLSSEGGKGKRGVAGLEKTF